MTDALERLRYAIRAVPAALARFSDADASAPQGPGRWARKDVIGHLIDSASNNHQRFVRGQLQAGQTFPRYDQDGWVRVQQYRAAPWAELIDLWRLYNAHLARVAATMTAEARRATCRVGDGDPVTLEALFVDYVDHLEHHLRRMLGAWPATGEPT